MANPITQQQHDFYLYQEALDNKPADNWLKATGLKPELFTAPNVNLFCVAHAIQCATVSGVSLLSTVDAKYLAQFKRHWKATNGKVTSKNKKRVVGIIKYYTQKQQNLLLREKRLTRNKKPV
tara:strand:+ start:135 stop:500 length:366 start_codon:yes stop_codon:yes gene_type:complete